MRLVVFSTFEMSLAKWDKAGMLVRELALYRRLAEKGVETDLITYGDNTDLRYTACLGPSIRVHPLFAKGPTNRWIRFFLSWLAPFWFRKIVRGADFVKTNQMWGCWAGMVCKIFSRKKWILRTGFEHTRHLQAERARRRDRIFSCGLSWCAYRLADVVVWSNECDRRWATDYFGLDSRDSRLKVIRNYVETRLFSQCPISSESRRVLTVGRLVRQKNLETLIGAMEGKPLELEIVGDGELRDELEQLGRTLNVEIDFAGRLDNEQIRMRMAQARMFVLCSHYEGSPKALLEAMSCGMGVIGSDIPSISAMIEHEVNGLLVQRDRASLSRAIDRLSARPELCARLGREAARYVRQNHTLDLTVERELSIYKDLRQDHPTYAARDR